MCRHRISCQHGIHQADAQAIDLGGSHTAKQVQLSAGPVKGRQEQAWLVQGELEARRLWHQRRNDYA